MDPFTQPSTARPLTGDWDTDTAPTTAVVNPPLTHTAPLTLDELYERARNAASLDELLDAAEAIRAKVPGSPRLGGLPAELLALRLAERQALAAEATFNLLAELVNGLAANPMMAAMMGGR